MNLTPYGDMGTVFISIYPRSTNLWLTGRFQKLNFSSMRMAAIEAGSGFRGVKPLKCEYPKLS